MIRVSEEHRFWQFFLEKTQTTEEKWAYFIDPEHCDHPVLAKANYIVSLLSYALQNGITILKDTKLATNLYCLEIDLGKMTIIFTDPGNLNSYKLDVRYFFPPILQTGSHVVPLDAEWEFYHKGTWYKMPKQESIEMSDRCKFKCSQIYQTTVLGQSCNISFENFTWKIQKAYTGTIRWVPIFQPASEVSDKVLSLDSYFNEIKVPRSLSNFNPEIYQIFYEHQIEIMDNSEGVSRNWDEFFATNELDKNHNIAVCKKQTRLDAEASNIGEISLEILQVLNYFGIPNLVITFSGLPTVQFGGTMAEKKLKKLFMVQFVNACLDIKEKVEARELEIVTKQFQCILYHDRESTYNSHNPYVQFIMSFYIHCWQTLQI